MSKRSVATQPGKRAIIDCLCSGVSESLYANVMYVESGKSAEKRPPTGRYASPGSSGKFGDRNGPESSLTEATSNAILPPAAVCHSGAAASWLDITVGKIATNPAVTSHNFLPATPA